MIELIQLIKLNSGKKKYKAIFNINGKKKSTTFGARGYSDYTIHKDINRRNRYIARHLVDLKTKDPTRAGYLSMYIIWNYPTVEQSVVDYKKRLKVYNDTGVFPTKIKNYSNNFGKNKFGESPVPDNVVDKELYKKIKIMIRKDVDAQNRRWGLYDSSRLVKKYKEAGGKYSGKSENGTTRWYKEKWINACVWPKIEPCGRKDMTKSIAYCRPSIKVSKKTPKLVQELTQQEIKKRCFLKKNNPKLLL